MAIPYTEVKLFDIQLIHDIPQEVRYAIHMLLNRCECGNVWTGSLQIIRTGDWSIDIPLVRYLEDYVDDNELIVLKR